MLSTTTMGDAHSNQHSVNSSSDDESSGDSSSETDGSVGSDVVLSRRIARQDVTCEYLENQSDGNEEPSTFNETQQSEYSAGNEKRILEFSAATEKKKKSMRALLTRTIFWNPGELRTVETTFSSAELSKILCGEIKRFNVWITKTYVPVSSKLESNHKNTLKTNLKKLLQTLFLQVDHSQLQEANMPNTSAYMDCAIDLDRLPTNTESCNKPSPSGVQNVDSSSIKSVKKPKQVFNAEVYYPDKLLQMIESSHGFRHKHMQTFDFNIFRCLICNVTVTGVKNVLQHLRGNTHQKCLLDGESVLDVKAYHKAWSKFSQNMKMHQIYFFPEDEHSAFCVLCETPVNYPNVIQHISGKAHSNALQAKGGPLWKNTVATPQVTNEPKVNVSLKPEQKLPVAKSKKKSNKNTVKNPSTVECKVSPLAGSLSKINLDPKNVNPTVGQLSIGAITVDKSKPCKTSGSSDSSNVSNGKSEASKSTNTRNLQPKPLLEIIINDASSPKPDAGSIHTNTENGDPKELNNECAASGAEISNVHNKNSVIPVTGSPESNTYFIDIWKLIPSRFKQHILFIETKSTDHYCKLCNVVLAHAPEIVITHLIDKSHLDLVERFGTQLKRFVYRCNVCCAQCGTEYDWQKHLCNEKHLSRCVEWERKEKKTLFDQQCKTCDCVIFGDLNGFRHHRHVTQNREKKKAYKLPPNTQHWLSTPKSLQQLANSLTDTAVRVMLNQEANLMCCRALEAVLSQTFPNCKAYCFGSRVSGLGDLDSDLDVFLDIGGMYYGNENQDGQVQANFVRTTARSLWRFRDIWSNLEPVPQARTPIVRVFHRPTNLDCDVSFRHGLSVENTKLLCFYMKLQPVTRPLILYLKKWSIDCQFHFKISSYALSVMAIFFLQTQHLLLPLSTLRSLYNGPKRIIAGWDCSFVDGISPVPFIRRPDLTVIQVLLDFFKYYADFDYEKNVVCPLLGITVPKVSFHTNEMKDLPLEMSSYVLKVQGNPDFELFRSLSALCVQDPFDLSHNLTKALPERVVKKFKDACLLSYNTLLQAC